MLKNIPEIRNQVFTIPDNQNIVLPENAISVQIKNTGSVVMYINGGYPVDPGESWTSAQPFISRDKSVYLITFDNSDPLAARGAAGFFTILSNF